VLHFRFPCRLLENNLMFPRKNSPQGNLVVGCGLRPTKLESEHYDGAPHLSGMELEVCKNAPIFLSMWLESCLSRVFWYLPCPLFLSLSSIKKSQYSSELRDSQAPFILDPPLINYQQLWVHNQQTPWAHCRMQARY
jgi:hypothetical protein